MTTFEKVLTILESGVDIRSCNGEILLSIDNVGCDTLEAYIDNKGSVEYFTKNEVVVTDKFVSSNLDISKVQLLTNAVNILLDKR